VQAEHEFAVLLVEHDVEMVSNLVTRLYVFDFGELIAGGPTAEVLGDEAVRKAYLGDMGVSVSNVPTRRRPRRCRDLELCDVEASYGPFRSLFGISFSIAQGG